MRIEVADLRKISSILFTHLEAVGLDAVEIDQDFYWNIPKEQAHNFEVEPTDWNIGQYSDDWECLMRIKEGSDDPISYALVWLGAILRAVGEKATH